MATPVGPPGEASQPTSPIPLSPNPSAPPGVSGGAPFTYGAMPRSFPSEMTSVVSQLSWWMRFLSVTYYIVSGLLVLMLVAFMAVGANLPGRPQGLVVMVMAMFAFFAVVGMLAATWLMQAAAHFTSGVHSGDTGRLFQGFRSLKLYLIVYVIWAGVSLLGQLTPFALLAFAN